jgi:hypothetical protein
MRVSQDVKEIAVKIIFFFVFLFASIKFISRGNIGVAENTTIVLIAAFLYQFLHFYDSSECPEKTVSESPAPFRWFEREPPKASTKDVSQSTNPKIKNDRNSSRIEPFIGVDMQKGVSFTQNGHVRFSYVPKE